jgi:hypothetical protein
MNLTQCRCETVVDVYARSYFYILDALFMYMTAMSSTLNAIKNIYLDKNSCYEISSKSSYILTCYESFVLAQRRPVECQETNSTVIVYNCCIAVYSINGEKKIMLSLWMLVIQ